MYKKTEIQINDKTIRIKIYHPFLRKVSDLKAVMDNEVIVIGDIQPAINNMGIGTRMMDSLIDYARKNNFREITGWISSVDKGHVDRLRHFYNKFGFEIMEPDDREDKFKLYDIRLKL